MSKVSQFVRARVGVVAAGAVLVLGGAGAATAAVVTSSSDAPAEQVAPDPSEQVPTEVPSGEAVGTVEDVPDTDPSIAPERTPAPASAPTPATAPDPVAPEDQSRSGIGTTGADGVYTPAPPVQNPGEPPAGNDGPVMPPADPLPGELQPAAP